MKLERGQCWGDRVIVELREGGVTYVWLPLERTPPLFGYCQTGTFRKWAKGRELKMMMEEELHLLTRDALLGVLRKDNKRMSMYIAMAVRNNIEDFHADHLSDAQMKELNPLIRGAVFTALEAFTAASAGDERALRWLQFQLRLLPSYWEPPELMEDYVLGRKNEAVP